MNNYRYYGLLVSALVLVMPSPYVLRADATPTYTPGVTAGQWAILTPVNVTYHGTSQYAGVPQVIKDLNATARITGTIQQVSFTDVTLQSVTVYRNSTSQTTSRYGDLLTGVGNLTFGLIAGGLSAGDQLWVNTHTFEINWTLPLTYLGVPRFVNIFNTTYSIPFGHGFAVLSQEYVWDQMSGIALEYKVQNLYPDTNFEGGYVEYSDVKIQSTDIFSNPVSPGFTVTASSASASTGSSAISTIAIGAVNGFTDTVALTDTVPSYLNCNPISPSTVTGDGTASLSCQSTIPGVYNVTVTASSGPISHTATTTIIMTASPSNTPSAPANIFRLAPTVFYAIVGGVMIMIGATGGFLFLRSRSERKKKQSKPMTAA